MLIRMLLSSVCLLLLSSTATGAPDNGVQRDPAKKQDRLQERENRQEQKRDSNRERDRIYGWQLMSPVERQLHRQKMRSFKTREEREAYRKEHHKKMQERAKEKGVELQDLKE